MAARGITTTDLKRYYLEGESGYLNAEEELNAICSIFGQGKGAVEASSIDFEKISKYGNSDLSVIKNYGNIYTFRFPRSGSYMQYKEEKPKDDNTREIITDWTNITGEDSQTFRFPGSTVTISSNKRNNTGVEVVYTAKNYNLGKILKNNDVLLMLQANSSYFPYWLADRAQSATIVSTTGRAGFSVQYIYSNRIEPTGLICSNEYEPTGSNKNFYVVPVVTLYNNIEIEKNDVNDGSTYEKACIIK